MRKTSSTTGPLGTFGLTTVFLTVACTSFQSPRFDSKIQDYHAGVPIQRDYAATEETSPAYTASSVRSPQPDAKYVDDIDRPREGQAFVLQWPTRSHHLSRGFEPPSDPHHFGIDITGRWNAPVRAAHDGYIVYAGHGYHGYGRMILLEFNSKWATLYAHLHKILVHQGQRIRRGQIIGTMGTSGNSTGVHLHFELMKNKNPINPLPLL